MHELSIAESIVTIAAEEAARLGSRVRSAVVRVGRLVQIEPENLLFCLGILREDREETRGAEFTIEEESLQLLCRECGHKTVTSEVVFACAACRSSKVDVVAGDALEILSMEVDVGESGCEPECPGSQ
ncbi:hypothetical protein CVV65_06700 [Kyrpidia spormannii]|uniref:Hydrogenase maturation factor HypA n=2 Tax=Kyrpidia spormannii TaxID=2055160 RepID=A0A2K8N6F6_9BACL|nr:MULTISPECIES: hydrogenase maturation nickel metallochaperone HypA [Kyrpidia]HHY68380.1 hydrogenase maturation nickel metallochaperone HypA [Alicyclobacillus sp.]ATY84665.1 hypothetical protein CVV65_06700 [Kyrpidia spormannii]MCL6577187.1 hydrogenase maturation nickel metallochaperone HypA [Kyrpidia sp.]CAB3391573.1 Hydrogenase maturation factor, HypA [Kyrpidia spormannii]CAB3392485.1 Hydrogenase maturation factor HypA [Kyrpidia spormannii]